MTRPMVSAARVGQATVTPAGGGMPSAKTIGGLNPITDELRLAIRQFLLPTEFYDEAALTRANFVITVDDILKALTKGDVGLDKVDNTPDLEKPLSQAMIAALEGKQSTDWRPSVTEIQGLTEELTKYRLKEVKLSMTEVEGLAAALAEKANKVHTHVITDVEGLKEILEGLAPINHTHSLTSLQGWTEFNQQLQAALIARPTVEQTVGLIKENALYVKNWEWED